MTFLFERVESRPRRDALGTAVVVLAYTEAELHSAVSASECLLGPRV